MLHFSLFYAVLFSLVALDSTALASISSSSRAVRSPSSSVAVPAPSQSIVSSSSTTSKIVPSSSASSSSSKSSAAIIPTSKPLSSTSLSTPSPSTSPTAVSTGKGSTAVLSSHSPSISQLSSSSPQGSAITTTKTPSSSRLIIPNPSLSSTPSSSQGASLTTSKTTGLITGSSSPIGSSSPSGTITSSSSSSDTGAVLAKTSYAVSFGSSTITPVFQQTTYSQYSTLSSTITSSTTESNGHIVPLIIWPRGLGWTCILFCGGGGVGGAVFGGEIPFPTAPPKELGNNPTNTDTQPTSTKGSTTSSATSSASSSSSSSSAVSSSSSSSSSGTFSVSVYPSGNADTFEFVPADGSLSSLLAKVRSAISSMESDGSSIAVQSSSFKTSPSPSATVTKTTPISTTMPISSASTAAATSSRSIASSSVTSKSASSSPAPICSEGNNSLMGFNNNPSSWCFCGGRGPFSTIPSRTTSYCDFSTLPTQTISLTSISTSIATACSITTGTYTPPGSASPTVDTYCQCGETMAGIGTTTQGSVVYAGCQITTPWPIVSTISTIPPPPYQTGTCDLHVFEASESYQAPLYVQLNITDGANKLLASQDFQMKWGENATVSAKDSKLPYDIDVDFLRSSSEPSKKKRVVGPVPVPTINWEDWIVAITAGGTSWTDKETDSSKLPYCSVGGWDNGNFWDWLDSVVSLGGAEHIPNRQMDCHWSC